MSNDTYILNTTPAEVIRERYETDECNLVVLRGDDDSPLFQPAAPADEFLLMLDALDWATHEWTNLADDTELGGGIRADYRARAQAGVKLRVDLLAAIGITEFVA